jgi:uncharacterized protein
MPTHPMRRHDRAVTDLARIDRLLAAARYYTLALVDGDEPYVVTLSYGFDPEARRLYSHVAPAGRKLDIIAADPKACGTVVHAGEYLDGECKHPYESVVLCGRMRLVEDPAEERHGMRVLMGQLESDPDASWDRNQLDGESPWRRLRVLSFDIEMVSAKQGS